MHALTILQPWAACIAHGPKRVENRSWRSPATCPLPFELAIHAAARKRSRAAELDDLWDIELEWPAVRTTRLDRGCVVAVALVVDFREYQRQSLFLRVDDDPWAVGPVCWLLENVRTLPEPVPCKGQQSLWTLPKDVEARVLEQLS
jgi:hypothetical protein